MAALGSLVVKLALEHAEYVKGLDKSSQEALKFAKNTQKSFDDFAASGKSALLGLASNAVPAIAAVTSVGAAISTLNKSINELAFLDDFSQKTGIAVNTASRLQKVAIQFSQDFGVVEQAVIKLSRNMGGFDDEGNAATAALDRLGISSRTAAGALRDPGDVVIEVAKKLQTYQDDAAKARIATELFGKSGADLIPYLNDVAGNVDKFSGVSKEAVERASRFQDELGGLKVQTDELFQSLAIGILPALTGTVTLLNEVASAGKSVDDIFASLEKRQPFKFQPESNLSSPGVGSKGFLPGVDPKMLMTPGSQSIDKQLKDEASKFRNDNPFRDQQAMLDAYNAKLERLNELERRGAITTAEAARYRAQFTAEFNKSNEALQKNTSSKRDLKKATEELLPYQKEQIELAKQYEERNTAQFKADQEYTAALNASRKSVDDLLTSTHAQIEATQRQIDELIYGKDAVEQMEIARLRDTAAAYEQNAAVLAQIPGMAENTKYVQDMAQKYRDLADAREQAMSRDKMLDNLRTAKEQTRQVTDSASVYFNRLADDMNRALTDSLFRSFDSGEGFGKAFMKNLQNYAKTLTLRFGIDFITKPLANVMQSNFGGLFSGNPLMSNFNATGGAGGFGFGDLLQSLNSNMTDSITKLGALIANGNGGIADTIGGFMGQYGSQIATTAAFLPALISLAKGDLKGAAFSGGGAAIGSLWGPGGAAIGATLGSLVGGLFGGEKNPRYTSQYQSVYGNKGLIRSGNVNADGKDTAMFNAGLNNLNNAFAKNLTALLDVFDKDLGKLTVNSIFSYKSGKQFIGGQFGTFNGKGFGFQSEGFGKDGEAAMKAYVDAVLGRGLASAIQASSLDREIRQLFSGLTTQKQVSSVITSVARLQSANEELADELGITVNQAAAIAKASGNVVKYSKLLADTAYAFKKPSEILLDAQSNLSKAIKAITGEGASVQSLEQFDALLKSRDLTTKEGRKQYADLLKLRESAAGVTGSLDSLKGGVKSGLFGILSPEAQKASATADLNKTAAELGIAVPTSIQDLINLGNTALAGLENPTEAVLDLAAAFPKLVEQFNQVTGGVEALTAALDETDFKTLVDFNRAKAYVANGLPIPAFAAGGDFSGGVRLVGERGPELEFTGPSRILNARKTEQLLGSSGNSDVLSELRRLNGNLVKMREFQSGENLVNNQYLSRVMFAVEQMNQDGVVLRNIDNAGETVILDVRVV